MAKPIPGFTASDGRIFTNYLTCLRHEVFIVLNKLGHNEIIARKIAGELTLDSCGKLMDVLEDIEEEMENPASYQVFLVPKA